MSQRLVELLEPLVEDLGFVLWHLELQGSGDNRLLRLYIDVPERSESSVVRRSESSAARHGGSDTATASGVMLEDCERVSREVGAALDVADPLPGAYRLEVSSPGLDRPLVKPEHFRRFLGERARVTLYAPIGGRRRFTGVLYGLDDEGVRVACEDGTVALPYAAIAKARLAPEFK